MSLFWILVLSGAIGAATLWWHRRKKKPKKVPKPPKLSFRWSSGS